MTNIAEELSFLMKDIPDRLMIDGVGEGWESLEEAIVQMPTTPIEDQIMGQDIRNNRETKGNKISSTKYSNRTIRRSYGSGNRFIWNN